MTTLKEIAKVLVMRHKLKTADAEVFVQQMVEVINEGLINDRQVKIKGFGTFKLQTVKERSSVNISTGERVTIGEHDKVTFTPDNVMRDLINKPFAQFETVMIEPDSPLLDDNTDEAFDDMADEDEDETAVDNEKEALATSDNETGLNDEVKSEEESVEKVVVAEEESIVEKDDVKTESANDEEATDEIGEMRSVQDTDGDNENANSVRQENETSDNVLAAGAVNGLAAFEKETGDDVESEQSSDAKEETVSEEIIDTVKEETEGTKPVDTADSMEAEKSDTVENVAEESDAKDISKPVSSAMNVVEETENIEEEDADEEETSTSSFYDDDDFASFFELFGRYAMNKYSLIGCLVVGALMFALGYYAGIKGWFGDAAQQKPKVENVQEETTQPVQQQPADSIAKTDSVASATANPEPKKEAEQSSDDAETVSMDKYNKDARVRLGAYVIIGTEREVKVQAGQTLKGISKAHLGPDMECYVEAYNDIKSVEVGQVIKIPKLRLKKHKK